MKRNRLLVFLGKVSGSNLELSVLGKHCGITLKVFCSSDISLIFLHIGCKIFVKSLCFGKKIGLEKMLAIGKQ